MAMPIFQDIKRRELFDRAKILKHNYYRCLRDPSLHRLDVSRGDGHWQIRDREDTIAIAALRRWRRYRKKGIAGFCAELAGDYGENALFTVEPGMVVSRYRRQYRRILAPLPQARCAGDRCRSGPHGLFRARAEPRRA
ncbi:MAG: hypothetical protein R3C97_12790 [Geminicoccaceae bacterium]